MPVLDFYNPQTHQPYGSPYTWIQRVDSNLAVLNLGQVSGVKITNPGSGYTTAPVITVVPGTSGGTGLALTAIISYGMVVDAVITNPGSGYTSAPTITIAASATGAIATGLVYWSDGWHLLPGKAKTSKEFGQPETLVPDEGNQIFSWKKDIRKGTLTIELLQTDVLTQNFLTEEAHKYLWRVFFCDGVNEDIGTGTYKYRIFAGVRFPDHVKFDTPAETIQMNGIILSNVSAITIDETKLPGGIYGNTYDIAAGRIQTLGIEGFYPSV
jgi:hypothetical protein